MRIVRILVGALLLLIGLALLVLPGPGMAFLVAALLVLEREVPWAGRARQRLFVAGARAKAWMLSLWRAATPSAGPQ